MEITLAVILLVQGGRMAWTLLDREPDQAVVSPGASSHSPADASIFQRFDAFFRTGGQSSLAEATGAEAAQMRLYGVRAGADGAGSAIIGLADGRQMSVTVGEEVSPGLVLRAVGPDFVTLARGASLSRLIFMEAPAGAPAPPPPPPTPQVVAPGGAASTPAGVAPPNRGGLPGGVVDAAALVREAGLRPRMNGLRINGFTVGAQGGAALAATGLEPGDVVLAVNGMSLTSLERIEDLRSSLSENPSAEIRYERGGQVRTTTIRTQP